MSVYLLAKEPGKIRKLIAKFLHDLDLSNSELWELKHFMIKAISVKPMVPRNYKPLILNSTQKELGMYYQQLHEMGLNPF